MSVVSYYQLLFVIPGIKPLFAISRKHTRHSLKSRRNPLLLPQRKHLLTTLEANLGLFFALSICDFFAMVL
ncbi:MAG: hypothetical protein A2672_01620 [Candidatus Wildermuthbacteria bacterium RIFCSPHIGHO2_01_FULL_49_22b]|uniref:Uncharacterized protein n=1 Tax=Candidatus Wildermuthbacteria bacterium RIFCSPHIGHO2_01_FULL_49_22b TaxID=1802448 RepID=A0A1G2QW74_9BACT|nr:MAG: hypothetical protein A2672_01620 [Candidatus Wildermuthbacteria bacterium RIFCSPHIGHO2_01_FULL_49_22b]